VRGSTSSEHWTPSTVTVIRVIVDSPSAGDRDVFVILT